VKYDVLDIRNHVHDVLVQFMVKYELSLVDSCYDVWIWVLCVWYICNGF